MAPLHTILLPTDFSACASRAQHHALALARAHEAVLHVVHIAEPPRTSSVSQGAWWARAQARAGAAMDAAWATRSSEGLQVVRTVQPGTGEPHTATDIIAYGETCEADLIVMGTHGRRGLNRLLAGSVTEEVMRHAPCPVLAVREGTAEGASIDTVLVPLDLSEQSLQAWTYARTLAAAYDARLTLLHVTDGELVPATLSVRPYVPHLGGEVVAWTREEAERLVREARDDGLQAQYVLASGDPGVVICQQAQQADLVVMTSHGRTGLDRLLMGSVAETVTRNAPCPVLVVRPNLTRRKASSAVPL
jgi:nucleotide-binding universal stress UspA family protein